MHIAKIALLQHRQIAAVQSFFFVFCFSKKILVICLRNLRRILLIEYLARVRHALT